MGILLTDVRATGPRVKVRLPYPKYVTHADGHSCVVKDLEAHRALGEGWPRPDDEAEKPEETGEKPEKPKETKSFPIDIPKPKRGRPRKDAA